MQQGAYLTVRFASSDADLIAAQRLRYDVFVAELGGRGDGIDHVTRTETDRFDPYCAHLVLVDERRDPRKFDHVVGVYRVLTRDGAQAAGGFYCEAEFDVAPVLDGDRTVLELGRSCLHPAFRGGTAMLLLWQALARHVIATKVDLLFGVASFHGTDLSALAQPLSFLHRNHLAPPELRAKALTQEPFDMLPDDRIDRKQAMLATPSLIKAYLRMGGFVGQGAFVDRAFNTTDVFLILDTARINKRQLRIYGAVE